MEGFVERCQKHFFKVTFLRSKSPYGAPTNIIDAGEALIVPDVVNDDDKKMLAEILGRKIITTPCQQQHYLGEPGPRCSNFPVNQRTYELLKEGGILYHSSGQDVRELYDP